MKNQPYPAFLFSDTDLKIAKLDKKNNLKVFFEFPLPAGLIAAGEIKDPSKLSQFLIQVKTKTGLKDRFVVVGISEIKASTHSLVLPDLSPEEIDSAIKFQADSFLPFPYNDEYLDWMLITKTKKNKNKLSSNKILVSAVPKKIIDAYTACLEKAGLEPAAFETTSLSLLRLLPPEGKKLSFAAQLGETAVVLILGLKGNIEACSVIHKLGEFLATTQKMSNFYFPGNQKGKKPQNIYLCGKNVTQELLQKIKQDLKMHPFVLKTGVKGLPQNREIELAILLSLAKKDVKPPADTKTINILPQILTSKQRILSQTKKENCLVLILLFLLVAFNLITCFTYFKMRGTSQTKTETNYPPAILTKLNTQIDLINQISQQKETSAKILETVSLLSSPATEITGFSFDNLKGELTISGWAKTRDDLLDLKQRLEKESIFDQVTVPLSVLGKEKEIEFTVSLGVI